MYKKLTTTKFDRRLKKLVKNNSKLESLLKSKIKLLLSNRFDLSLGTHKITDNFGKELYTSKVNGDLRILWQFENNTVILLVTIGGHSGSKKVYVGLFSL